MRTDKLQELSDSLQDSIDQLDAKANPEKPKRGRPKKIKKEVKEEPKQEAPKIKRFANYELAFGYYLKLVHYYCFAWSDWKIAHQHLPGKVQRRWLREIFEEKQLEPNWMSIYEECMLITEKKSKLSRTKRDFLDELFIWVDHFVAGDGEEVTMTAKDLEIPYSTLKEALEYAEKLQNDKLASLNALQNKEAEAELLIKGKETSTC